MILRDEAQCVHANARDCLFRVALALVAGDGNGELRIRVDGARGVIRQ